MVRKECKSDKKQMTHERKSYYISLTIYIERLIFEPLFLILRESERLLLCLLLLLFVRIAWSFVSSCNQHNHHQHQLSIQVGRDVDDTVSSLIQFLLLFFFFQVSSSWCCAMCVSEREECRIMHLYAPKKSLLLNLNF